MSKSVKDVLKEKYGIIRTIKKIDGSFDCRFNRFNQLSSLEGSPEIVNGDFICYFNNLTSLEGAPIQIEGDFDCAHNKLTSLEGAPKIVDGDFICHSQHTKIKFTKDDIKEVCNVKGDIYV